ncbi:MAG: 2Fe-2S iron-sulfur cluster-binding protein, partial [Gemmatimonadota bacterium]
GACGACTVLEGDTPVRSCTMPLSAAEGRSFLTIEGLPSAQRDAVKRAWLEEDVSQCGYCQPGMILRTRALLADEPGPTDGDVDAALDGHVCRCGSYIRIRRAIHRAARAMASTDQGGPS